MLYDFGSKLLCNDWIHSASEINGMSKPALATNRSTDFTLKLWPKQ